MQLLNNASCRCFDHEGLRQLLYADARPVDVDIHYEDTLL